LAGLLCVLAAFAAASWFGLWLALPPIWRMAGLALFAAAALASLLPLVRFRWPSRDAALRRLEVRTGLDHRPLAGLADTLSQTEAASADPATRILWETHRRRLQERLGALRAGLPSPRLDRRDPYALRALAALLLVAGFFHAGEDRIALLRSAFATGPAVSSAPLRIDAWVAPPAYTGRAPIVLTSAGEQERELAPVSVPHKSAVVVRVEGGEAQVERVAPDGTVTPGERQGPGGRLVEYRVPLEADASVRVLRGDSRQASWSFTVEPDRAPVIALTKDPERAQSGAFKLSYSVEDDYGVVEAEARFAPLQAPTSAGGSATPARPLYGPPVMRLSLPQRRSRAGSAETMRDLTDHPWAGARVKLTLAARDEAEQWGTSPEKETVLPSRRFANPLARAVVEQRRLLAMDANARERVVRALDALMIEPERRINNSAVYLGLVTAQWRLKGGADDDRLRSVVDQLWEVALRIENGDLSGAERDLRAAQEALREALERGASDAEIEKLMQDLREAMNRFLNEMTAQMQRQPPQEAGPMPPNARMVTPQDLDRMMRQLEDLAKSGARDAAKELLAQLQNMMENMQAARPMPQQDGQQSQMGQAMDKLGDMIREQQRLMNETFRQGGQQGRQGRQQGREGRQQGRQPGQQPGQGRQPGQGQQPGQGGSPGELAEALRQLQEGQGALREQLQQLLDQLGQMGQSGQGSQQLGQAGESMGNAERSLGQGTPGDALDSQAQALERMRQGAQALQQQMADQMGPGQGRMQRGMANDDPLGRPRRNDGFESNSQVRVPDEPDIQRAREILEELRRRLSDPNRPRLELDYLERLIERF